MMSDKHVFFSLGSSCLHQGKFVKETDKSVMYLIQGRYERRMLKSASVIIAETDDPEASSKEYSRVWRKMESSVKDANLAYISAKNAQKRAARMAAFGLDLESSTPEEISE